MEEKKELKIKFRTAVILVIVLAIIIVAIFAIAIYKNKQINPTITGNQSSQTEEADFSIEFLKLENKEQNMVYSPLSIKYALNMLNEGANGNTKTQIENVIKNLSLTKYNTIDEVLSLANSVYIRDTYAEYVKQDYKNKLTEKYNAEINYDAFRNATNINNWIENKTLGIIKNMLSDNMVQNPSSKMLLINALAIDMEWENSFDVSDTNGQDFYLNDNNTMTATMMHKEADDEDVAYYKDKEITALTMDLKQYDDTQLQFVAIMPEDNLSEYIDTFTMDEYNHIIENVTLASETKNGVEISIPKFSFEYDLQLKNDLIDLGITDAFDENLADFSNMTDADTGLYVYDALHKAKIDFTERGIKAAAVTVMLTYEAVAMMDDNKPEKIRIDKPFLYFIRDKKTNEIWFVGTVYEPNSWEDDKEEYR